MTEDEKMQVAVFRFSVISDFVTAISMSRTEKKAPAAGEMFPQMANPFFRKDPDQPGHDPAMVSYLSQQRG